MAKIVEIQSIIEGHDTRQEALSLNDALVKDADKLWRFDPVSASIAPHLAEMAIGPWLDFIESKIESWMLTDRAKEIAYELLAQSRMQCAE